MSKHDPFVQVSSHVLRSGTLSPLELTLLLILASYKPCHPTRSQLARMTKVHVSTVSKSLITLRSKGLIKWYRGRDGKANRYWVNRHWLGPAKDLTSRFAMLAKINCNPENT